MAASSSEKRAHASDHPAAARRRCVWVVDDVAFDRERARRALAGRFDVRSFHTSSAMLEQLAAGSTPDVLVLDWLMPDVSGIDVSRYVRSLGHLAAVPILFLTARAEPERVAEGFAAGANDYLSKPFADVELVARVDALLRGRDLLLRAEQAERMLAGFLDAAPDALLVAGPTGLVEYANPEALRVLGRSSETVVGTPLDEVVPVQNVAAIRRAAAAETPLPDIELREVVLEPSARALSGGSMAVALRDVTEQRRRNARRLDLYALVAHDLRSPLTAMLMRLQLMLTGRRGAVPPGVADEITAIQRAANGLVRLINDFLDLARLEGAPHDIDRDEVDFATLVRSLCDELHPLAEANKIALSVATPDAAFVRGDRARLAQVVSNLLDNAIKFTPPGGRIEVRVTLEEGRIEMEVEDTGVGIVPELLPHVFQRYVRGAGASGRVAPSTGLGLLIVREIVEAHGGTVSVRSTPSVGTVFKTCLPA